MWPCYRLIHENMATVTELQTRLTLMDLSDMMDVLDAIAVAQSDK